MARHRKWAKVKHFKGATDATHGKLFSKLAREVFVAAGIGGSDPDLKARLRLALLRCRTASMPKDNCERASKRATGSVAVLADLSADNGNHTSAEIRRTHRPAAAHHADARDGGRGRAQVASGTRGPRRCEGMLRQRGPARLRNLH